MPQQAAESMPNMIPTEFPTQLQWSEGRHIQCRYGSSQSCLRWVFRGETIFKGGDESTRMATTPTANCCTWSAGTKCCEMHSPIGKADIGKCTWRRSNNCTLRTVKCPPRVVIPNTPADESRSCMSKLQSLMISQLSLDNPKINSCHWESTAESSLTNWDGARRSHNALVVVGAMTYTRQMTVPESKATSTTSYHGSRSAERKHFGAYLLAENCSCRLVDKLILEVITAECIRVCGEESTSAPGGETTSENDDLDTQTSDSKHTWRRNGNHTGRKASKQFDVISALSTGQMWSVPTSAPTRRMISATARAPGGWCDDQAGLIYAEWVQLCQLKHFWTSLILISRNAK